MKAKGTSLPDKFAGKPIYVHIEQRQRSKKMFAFAQCKRALISVLSLAAAVRDNDVCSFSRNGTISATVVVNSGCSQTNRYRSGTVNSKSFVGKVLLRIKRKFELTYPL